MGPARYAQLRTWQRYYHDTARRAAHSTARVSLALFTGKSFAKNEARNLARLHFEGLRCAVRFVGGL